MSTPLEIARNDPSSMKARILNAARDLFGEYGFHGVTTRMIAKEVGIDISTLHYHWGDKESLYGGVLADINDQIKAKLVEIESEVHGQPIHYRLEVAIDIMCDFLFSNPAVAKLVSTSYFGKTRAPGIQDDVLVEQTSNIAVAMGLAVDKKDVSAEANARVLAVSNSIYSFASGENSLRRILRVDRDAYIKVVKDTLKFLLIPAFTQDRDEERPKEAVKN
jgi:TetR/AcrR family transcriptional regulator, regulator of cefoperazone and chloramphenicol sensitivity